MEPDDQAQHRRRRLGRDGRPRARRHRPGGRDAGDGGQGDAAEGVRRRRRLAVCLATTDVDEIVAAVDGDRARLRRDQPGGHLGAALLRDRGAPPRVARHPGLPRRPARHCDRRLRRARQRAARRRQAARGRQGRHHRGRRRGHRDDADPATRRASGTSSAAIERRASTRGRPGLAGIKAEYAEATNPDRERGSADDVLTGADVYIGLSQPGAVSFDGIRAMADDAIVFAMANPTPEVAPEELDGPRRGRRDRPLRLPEPDQQRARVPGRLPRRARRACARHHRGHEARRRRGDRGSRSRPTSWVRSTSSRASSTVRSSAWSPPRSPRRRSATGSHAASEKPAVPRSGSSGCELERHVLEPLRASTSTLRERSAGTRRGSPPVTGPTPSSTPSTTAAASPRPPCRT